MGLYPKDRDLSQAPREVELAVNASSLNMRAEDVDIRLDAFLARHLTWRSRTSIQVLIRSGHALVDASTPDHPKGSGATTIERRPGRKLRHGSRVVVVIPEALRLPMLGKSSDELVVLFEDEAVLAVDKPPGLTVHPSGRHLTDTLIQRVHAKYGRGLPLERAGAPRLCHRLDRETSGIVLVGKNPIAQSQVRAQFEARKVGKEYLAIVRGAPDADGGVIDYPIGSARASKIGLKMTVAQDGLVARTEWRVIERHDDCALVSCVPLTGRQHQIRVHMAAIGHALVGDKIYGPDEELFEKGLAGELTLGDLRALGMPRQALHNHRVVFVSPASGATVEVTSPLPPDMETFLADRV